MNQNLLNYFFNKIDAKLNYSSYYDFFLASDEKDYNSEVIFSNQIIGYNNNKILGAWIDFNNSGSSQNLNITCGEYNTGNTALSLIAWCGATSIPYCSGDSISITDINFTGIDNGLLSSMTGNTIYLMDTLTGATIFNPLFYDKKLKLHQITGYSKNIAYNMSATTDSSGRYMNLNGGFYQGFYKLFGYDYEVLPNRPNLGWTLDFLLKFRNDDICTGTTLNDLFTGNTGFFYYVGTRSENKYWDIFSGETGITTSNGVLLSPTVSGDPELDIYSNNLGFRFTPDRRIGYRKLTYTGACVTTGTCDNSGMTFESGYTVNERYSDQPICSGTTGVTSGETWVSVTVKFKRKYYFEDCDLLNYGGLNDIITMSFPPGIDTIFGYNNLQETETILLNKLWLDEIDFRMGTLTFYVNGRPALIVNDFEEVIPRELNTDYTKQIGVPFNISLGGGAIGLYESLTYSGSTGTTTTDVLDENLLIEQYFAGSFDGGLSQFRYYVKPLTADEIYHNFMIDKSRYNLIDCWCNYGSCRPGLTIFSGTCC